MRPHILYCYLAKALLGLQLALDPRAHQQIRSPEPHRQLDLLSKRRARLFLGWVSKGQSHTNPKHLQTCPQPQPGSQNSPRPQGQPWPRLTGPRATSQQAGTQQAGQLARQPWRRQNSFQGKRRQAKGWGRGGPQEEPQAEAARPERLARQHPCAPEGRPSRWADREKLLEAPPQGVLAGQSQSLGHSLQSDKRAAGQLANPG